MRRVRRVRRLRCLRRVRSELGRWCWRRSRRRRWRSWRREVARRKVGRPPRHGLPQTAHSGREKYATLSAGPSNKNLARNGTPNLTLLPNENLSLQGAKSSTARAPAVSGWGPGPPDAKGTAQLRKKKKNVSKHAQQLPLIFPVGNAPSLLPHLHVAQTLLFRPGL